VNARRLPTLAAVALMGLACAGGAKTGATRRAASDTLTERQRDTMLSQSSIPGASAVGKAMRVADSTSAQIRSTDSIGP
jgi:hypothetical protein